MSASFRPILDTKGEVADRTREMRNRFRALGPQVKAKDIALALYDGFRFSGTLTRLLIIDALTAVARTIIQNERAGVGAHAAAGAGDHSGGGTVVAIQPEFPDFEDICRECPRNYALPGDNPEDTVYIETFDGDFEFLVKGYQYLRRHGQSELRHAAALENLYLLCRRLKGSPGETPREILKRHRYDPGD